ncbi:hypothetical protein RHSIM_Rhsim01G0150400 [Rhododendron simsii]|uniref:Uncharacterized protein n=1 Tax=Rhododendron simsii TaxID=118357 RepID=A0A834LVP2_RHOSS|nr:hypothetical protein RHSIM_Rhsim01G0150400 [Rhododendron simsii]
MDNLSIKNLRNPVRLLLDLLSNQSPAAPEALHSTDMLCSILLGTPLCRVCAVLFLCQMFLDKRRGGSSWVSDGARRSSISEMVLPTQSSAARRWFWGTIFLFAVKAKLPICIWFEVIVMCCLVSFFDRVRGHRSVLPVGMCSLDYFYLLLVEYDLQLCTIFAGATAGSFTGGTLVDKFGRTKTFQLDAIPLEEHFFVPQSTVYRQIIGRLLAGIGIDISSAIVPLYISEISPTEIRGTLGSIRKSFMQGKFSEAEMTIKRLFGKERVAEVMNDFSAASQGSSEPEGGCTCRMCI